MQKKRTISLLLAIMMLFSLLPTSAFAAEGDSIVILEAMKMEIPVVAPQDGTVASIDVAAGAAVESGDVLATLN